MTQHVVNGVAHFDLAGPDLAALAGFYRSVFGWQVDLKGPGYALVATPDGSPDGAIAEREAPSLTVGVVVADVQVALDQAVAAGGRVTMPVTDNGWVVKGAVADPAGNEVTIIGA